jgi:hypothetical protein
MTTANLAVADNESVVQYESTGETVFAYPFPILAAEELKVSVNQVLKTLGVDYTLDGIGDAGGGDITFTAATTAGQLITAWLDMPIKRLTGFSLGAATLLPQALNTEFVRQVRVDQMLRRDIARTLRIPIDDPEAGQDLELPTASVRAGKFLRFDETTGNPEVATLTELEAGVVVLSRSIIGEYFYPLAPSETADQVVNYFHIYGDVRRYGVAGDGATDITALLQTALDASAGAFPVRVPKAAGYYRVTGRLTAPASTHIILEQGAELHWTATTATGTNFLGGATRPGIEVEGDNFKIEGRGILSGPSVDAYVANEIGIYMAGADTDDRKSGLFIGWGVEIKNFGAYGVLPFFTDNVDIIGAHIHHCGYVGILPTSSNHGRIQNCRIHDMTPGTGGEMHGISLGSDSTDYDQDPNAATNGRLAANPFPIDWDISCNLVYNMISWTGIDAHGAYETHVHHNKVYNCRRGIQVASQSGDATPYAGESNSITYNSITARKIDGTATEVTGGYIDGITVNGGATVNHRGVHVIGNDIEGCGAADNNAASITASVTRDVVIAHNTIRNWAGVGIYTVNGEGVIHGNIFGALSTATTSRCIRVDTTTDGGGWTVTGNRHRPKSGTLATEGLRFEPANPLCVVGDNDFEAATTAPYVGQVGTNVVRRRLYGASALQHTVKAYSASITIDSSTGDQFDITAADGNAFTINAPTSVVDGQLMTLTIRNTSGGALGTITWNGIFKMSAWTSPATGFNRSITFRYRNDAADWVEVSRTPADVPN